MPKGGSIIDLADFSQEKGYYGEFGKNVPTGPRPETNHLFASVYAPELDTSIHTIPFQITIRPQDSNQNNVRRRR